jgi:chorismate mutase/prephenate dehydratase
MNRQIRRKTTVAHLGPRGTFCEQAAKKKFPSAKYTLAPYPSISDVFKAVKSEEADYGVVPVENSLDGSVHLTLDLLLDSDLMVCRELEHRIIHNLISKPGTKLETIRIVMSHPQALAQCRLFLEKNLPRAELREVNSTAKAVELIKHTDNAGAIGTGAAAKNNRMEIMARGIEDDPHNFTRFFVLSKEDSPPTGRDKTSLIFSAKDVPGSLHKILSFFAIRDINLTKIESRPERGKPWKYIFYLDFEGHRTEDKGLAALEDMEKQCIFVKVLGSYPRSRSGNCHT